MRPHCPYGTDAEGEELQRECQQSYYKKPTKKLHTIAPFAMTGGFVGEDGFNPTANARKLEYAKIGPSNDSLSMFMENQVAYAQQKLKTTETEAAVSIFPPGKPPRTRQRARRVAPPPTTEESTALHDCYVDSHAVYDRMRRHARDDSVFSVVPLPPPAAPRIVAPKSTLRARGGFDPTMLGQVDPFKHYRSRRLKIEHVDDVSGADKCGVGNITTAQTVDCYSYALSKRNGLKMHNQRSDDCRASIFGY